MAAGSRHQTKDGETGDCWQGTVADRGDSSSGLDGGRGRGVSVPLPVGVGVGVGVGMGVGVGVGVVLIDPVELVLLRM